MPDFRDSFTVREVCEGMGTEITVLLYGQVQFNVRYGANSFG